MWLSVSCCFSWTRHLLDSGLSARQPGPKTCLPARCEGICTRVSRTSMALPLVILGLRKVVTAVDAVPFRYMSASPIWKCRTL